MAEKEPGDERPSLEMPSLGFGRKRRKAAPPEPEPEASEPATPEPVAPEPVAPEVADPSPTERLDPVPPAPAAPPLFADETPATSAAAPAPAPAPAPPSVAPELTHDEDEADTDPAPGVRRQRRSFALPRIGGMAASLVTGVLVGLLTVGLTWGSLRLCEVVQGTPSCGNPGFFLLLAIMVAMVLVGRVLLHAFGVVDPGSTSFLGMGLVAVVALLFLVDLLFLWWMVIVIPAVAMASYALAHWVTTSLAETAEETASR